MSDKNCMNLTDDSTCPKHIRLVFKTHDRSKCLDLTFVEGKESLTAEVLWALKGVCAHYSYKSCENISDLFMHMFPDSAIAQKFLCGERKCAYLVCFGIAPFFQQ